MELNPDLRNMLFDQCDHETLAVLRSLSKRKTAYAKKYSVLIHYDVFNKHAKNIGLKTIKRTAIDFIIVDALECSIMNGHIEEVKYLAERGIDFNPNTALIRCAEFGQLEVVKYLLSMFLFDSFGDAIMISARYGFVEITKYLCLFGDKHVVNFHGRYNPFITKAFVENATHNRLKSVMCLVELGADIHDGGEFALRQCAEYGFLEVVKYLVGKGANVNFNNGSALFLAAISGHMDVMKYLISRGAFINFSHRVFPNDDIFECCKKRGHNDMVEYLRSCKKMKISLQNTIQQ